MYGVGCEDASGLNLVGLSKNAICSICPVHTQALTSQDPRSYGNITN